MNISNILLRYSVNDIKRGYLMLDDEYQCLFCDRKYNNGEIYKINEKFYVSEKSMKLHILYEHKGVLSQLMNLDKKYTNLTEKQKIVINLMVEGKK